jgi:predicted regulator of Ras-like GTPase activity (Roadblock/LC7/MglB family)
MNFGDILEPIRETRGVRGALVVSRGDGLVVSSALASGVNGAAVAALSASLARRIDTLAGALGHERPALFELAGSEGSLLAATASAELLLVAVTSRDIDRERVHDVVLRVAREIG